MKVEENDLASGEGHEVPFVDVLCIYMRHPA